MASIIDNVEHRVRSPHNIVRRRSAPSPRPPSSAPATRRASKSANFADLETHAVNAPSSVCAHRRSRPFWTLVLRKREAVTVLEPTPGDGFLLGRHEMGGTAGIASGSERRAAAAWGVAANLEEPLLFAALQVH
jgi:hypothetical protein